MMVSYNFRYEKPPSAAVLQGRARRLSRAHDNAVRTQWFIEEVLDVVNTSMKKRVKIATEYLRSRIVLNISRPVTKTYLTRQVQVVNAKGKTVTKKEHSVTISNRSKSGEFPKADTVQLLKTIFTDVIELQPGCWAGFVGTPLLYGLVLELKMNRSFLVRTLNEERSKIMRILSGPL